MRDAAQWVLEKSKKGAAAVGLRGTAIIVLIVAALWGMRVAQQEAARMPCFRVYPERFRASAPPWCADDLAKVAFPQESYSIFDPDLTREVAEAYMASPWVAAVQRVAKRYPNELRIELLLREPAAFVRLPDGCYAVDARTICLPLDYRRWDHEQRPLPHIFGVSSQPPAPGQVWNDRRVASALSVLNAIAAEPTILRQIHIVDVGNIEGELDPARSELLLFTRRRVRIDWGRPADTTKFGEPTVAEKLARLRRWMTRPLTARAPLAGEWSSASSIDLRFPDEETAVARP